MKYLFLLLMLCSLPSFAQDPEIDLDEMSFEDLDKIDLKIQEADTARNLDLKEMFNRERRFKDYKYQLEMEDIEANGTFMGSIRKGVPIYRVLDNKKVIMTKDTYVRAYKIADSDHYIYILNSKNIPVYKVYYEKIINIERIVDLDVPPTEYTEVEHKIEKAKIDDHEELKWSMWLRGHLNYVVSNFTADLLNQPKANSGVGTRLDGALFLDWDFPVKIGAMVGYENFSFDLNATESAKLNTINIGPVFKFDAFTYKERVFRMSVGILTSLHSQITTPNDEIKLRQNSLSIEVGHYIPNSYGEFVFGFGFKRNWFRVQSNQSGITLVNNNRVDDSLGTFIGQTF
ncbi:MAG: hypothetical protein JNM93_11940 [Bacteriovoracaceae bacterium]|nr:hypothetical protein [Bacteriovoracaceae bacterium]